MNGCDIIETPNIIDDKNKNKPQNIRNEENLKDRVTTRSRQIVRPPSRLMELENLI